MTLLAPTIQAFFTERLMAQRRASPRTIAAYRDTLRLLVAFVQRRTSKAPSNLDLADLDAPLIGDFLTHLEEERGNSVRTRNARLAGIHSLFGFAALRHPEHAALIGRVLAIPPSASSGPFCSSWPATRSRRCSPARTNPPGSAVETHALLVVAIQSGLRVAELDGLRSSDVILSTGAHVRCHGKGRKERVTPLTAQTVAVLRGWMDERAGASTDPLFPSRRGPGVPQLELARVPRARSGSRS